MNNTYGVLAEFKNPKELVHAVKKVKEAGYNVFDTYTPFPIHGMDDAMGLKRSKLPWIVLVCGATGLLSGIALQGWVATTAYKLTISGKPFFSYQAFVPVTFELMVLFSAFGAVFGMFILNGLPKWYDPAFKHSRFRTATSHGFFLGIEAKDPLFDVEKTPQFLQSLGGYSVEVVSDD
jgi:hypothetical protein